MNSVFMVVFGTSIFRGERFRWPKKDMARSLKMHKKHLQQTQRELKVVRGGCLVRLQNYI